MRNLIRLATAAAAACAAVAVTATSAFATWTTTGQYGNETVGSYSFNNDEWGAHHGWQAMWVNDQTSWGIESSQPPGNGVESYPHAGRDVNEPLDSLQTVSSYWTETNPSGGTWESAYDIWLNGTGIEVMVWTDNSGQYPIGYNGSGPVARVRDSGATWDLYAGGNGANPAYSFVREGNAASGSVDLLSLLKYLENTKHYYSNPTLSQVQYGWEICGTTGSSEHYTIDNFGIDYS
jgi:hypothetical protein